MTDIARLTALIEPEAAALGLELVRVKMMPSEAGDGAQALQVMAEDPATGQLVIDQCAELSRRISDRIDPLEEAGEELVEGPYHLEVSSPAEGQRVLKGVLQGIAGDQVTIEDRKAGTVTLPLADIHTAQLVLTDALIAATRPLDMSGADEIVELNEEEKADD
ncbi:MAG: ribosome maturation factor [Pelagerythrobacter marensis]|nr:MAG: ribosome maturation factor [Pelagerythrobacter marensis]